MVENGQSIAVVGAGPAGSAAAFALASRGLDVTLIEQSRFPRDKVCGECLSALGIRTLAGLGLMERIGALVPVELSHVSVHAADGTCATFALPEPMWGLSRVRLDAALLAAARDAGARVLQPARCESVNGRLTVRDLENNGITHLKPDWTLLADGKSALPGGKPAATGELGVKAHFADVSGPRDRIELFGLHGHYVGVAPIEGDRWNVAFSVPTSKVRRAGGLEALWAALLAENGALGERFGRARRISDWLTSPLPRFAVRRDWPARVIPLGNAAAAIEPIGGEGMGLALRSAALAADALARADCDVGGLRREFSALWRSRGVACRALARGLSSRAISPALIRLARGRESVARAVMGLMGK